MAPSSQRDDSGVRIIAHALAEELDQIMQSDRAAERHDASERGWVPPPKGDGNIQLD